MICAGLNLCSFFPCNPIKACRPFRNHRWLDHGSCSAIRACKGAPLISLDAQKSTGHFSLERDRLLAQRRGSHRQRFPQSAALRVFRRAEKYFLPAAWLKTPFKGSDILLLTNFAFAEDPAAQLANIKDAIVFFQEKYVSDPNFQAAVDQRVKRIIRAKLKIYGQSLGPASNWVKKVWGR